MARRSLRVAVMLVGTTALNLGCATRTVWQRAERGETPEISEAEILAGLSEADATVRALAVAACAAGEGSSCVAAVAERTADPETEVRVAAWDALTARCESGGRAAMAKAARGLPSGDEAVAASAIRRCPSGEAVLALAEKDATASGASVLPERWRANHASPATMVTWLERLVELPAPRTEVEEQLRAARFLWNREERADARAELAERDTLEAAWLSRLAQDRVARLLRLSEEMPAPAHPWGPFEEWAASSTGKRTLAAIRTGLESLEAVPELEQAYEEERNSNDASERDPTPVPIAIYPEVTGSFVFIKALDYGGDQSLFSAQDGLFVLDLAPGASFTAAPGDPVYLTMHNRGDTVTMTDGRVLPVFHSGSSPYDTRWDPGFQPDRSKERRLLRKLDAAKRALERSLTRLEDETDPEGGGWVFDRTPNGVRAKLGPVDPSSDAATVAYRVVLSDAEDQPVFCLAVAPEHCDSARAFVPLGPVLAETDVEAQPLLIPRRVAYEWGLGVEGYDQPLEHLDAVSVGLAATCDLPDPLVPPFESAHIGNDWFSAVTCGHGLSTSFPALGRVVLSGRIAEQMELRCADVAAGWGDWRAATSGCSVNRLSGLETRFRGDAEADRQVELVCERVNGDAGDCGDIHRGPLRSVTFILRAHDPLVDGTPREDGPSS